VGAPISAHLAGLDFLSFRDDERREKTMNACRQLIVIVCAELASVSIGLAQTTIDSSRNGAREAPVAHMRPVIDDYFGTRINDPYRWMEEANSVEFDRWMRQQNDYARDMLARIKVRSELLKRIEQLSEQDTDARLMRLAQGRY